MPNNKKRTLSPIEFFTYLVLVVTTLATVGVIVKDAKTKNKKELNEKVEKYKKNN